MKIALKHVLNGFDLQTAENQAAIKERLKIDNTDASLFALRLIEYGNHEIELDEAIALATRQENTEEIIAETPKPQKTKGRKPKAITNNK